jgi:hypothetical protein
MIRHLRLALFLMLAAQVAVAQNTLKDGTLTGSFQLDAQYYIEDSLIDAPKVDEAMMMNAFASFIYTAGNFEAGLRYEAYLNPISGIDARYRGQGISNRYLTYKTDFLSFTVGSFYEVFGSGLILRAYEERNLGFDNSFDGVRLIVKPISGITIRALAAKQRYFWDLGEGIVRAADAEISLNEVFKYMAESKTRYSLGLSFVSRFQDDRSPFYKLPENVAATNIRLGINRGSFGLKADYAYKVNDPSLVNGTIYKPGSALLIETSYSKKGLGIYLGLKHIDNFDFRSDRNETGNALLLNFLPSLTKQHVYSLSAIYPYATQAYGEMGAQVGVVYTLAKGSKLGGKYGTTLSFNYSISHDIARLPVDDTTAIGEKGTLGYKTDFLSIGDQRFFQDLGIEISRKLNNKLKLTVSWVNFEYDIATIEGHPGEPMVYANVGIADLTFKYGSRKTLRFETQHLWTHQDDRNWAMAMVEWTLPRFFVSAMDQYNYGNPLAEKKIHYYNLSAGYLKGGTRISLGYGKQREGIVCVGGVCRAVPASNGFTLSVTSSF